jgi:hypothetical protein
MIKNVIVQNNKTNKTIICLDYRERISGIPGIFFEKMIKTIQNNKMAKIK